MDIIRSNLPSSLKTYFKLPDSKIVNELITNILNQILPPLYNYLVSIGLSGDELFKKVSDEIGAIFLNNLGIINDLINKNISDIAINFIPVNKLTETISSDPPILSFIS